MVFQSFEFVFIFLPLTFILWALLRKDGFFANLFLIAASAIFYGFNHPYYLVPLCASAITDFYVGNAISRCNRTSTKYWLLATSVSFNFALLFFFKYYNWVAQNANVAISAVGFAAILPIIAVSLPPGISFYTFQTVSYTVDIYRGAMKPGRSILNYMSFVLFFPHLVAGPIVRARDLLPQLSKPRSLPAPEIVNEAMCLIIWGLFKKMVFADNFGGFVDYAHAELWQPGAGVLYGYAFALQIYCDFSAYTDIARGTALLLGIELCRNFKTPFFAASPSDFWRRWHISLSTWIRDYIYIPLGGNRGTVWTTGYTVLLTMLLGGIWHGAHVSFVAWGLYHGLLLITYRLLPLDVVLGRIPRIGRALAVFVFFNLGAVGWALFRSGSTSGRDFLVAMNSTWAALLGGLSPRITASLWPFGLFAGLFLITEITAYRRSREFPDVLMDFPPWAKAATFVALYFIFVFLARRSGYAFIYFQF